MSNYTLPSSPPDERDYEKPFDEVQADEERHEKMDKIIWSTPADEHFDATEMKKFWADEFSMWGDVGNKGIWVPLSDAINSIENK